MAVSNTMRRLFKPFSFTTFLDESKEQLKIAWILSIFMLLEYLLSTTSIIFCGRLGQPEMAAAGMAQSIISIFCFMPGYGMVTVCNTYFSSGAGAKDEYRQGVILQKALILSGLVTLFCWPILINTDGMLRLFQQDPEITIMVGNFVRVYLPAVPALFASFVLSRFLQCRNHVMITMLAMLFSAIVNIVLNYVFLFVLLPEGGDGVSLSSGAMVISQYTYLIIICAYLYKYETFIGFSTESLEDWYEFSAIGTHGCLMVELEILLFEAGYFLCGTFDAAAVDVFGAVYIMVFYTFMICSGIASALAIRIGQSLGANETGKAKVSMEISFLLCWIYAAIVSVIFLLFPNKVGFIFTSDKTVVAAIADIVPILVIFEISDLTSNVAKGALQGCGRQSAGALIAFISYYFIGMPVCVYLVMFRRMRAMGMWIGLCLGNGSQAICLFTYTLTIDWDREATLSQERLSIIKSEALIDGNLNELKSKEDMFLEMETGKEISEKVPLVQDSGKGFELSRATIYIRVINFAVAGIALLVGVAIFFTSY